MSRSERIPVSSANNCRCNAITYTSAVPTLWEAILDADPRCDDLAALAFVIVGGEALLRP